MNDSSVTVPVCGHCGKVLKGRAGKKFCDDSCRNAHNNQIYSEANNYIRNINHSLKKNRRILEEMLPASKEKTSVPKDKLLQAGFQFKYITHIYTSKKTGKIYYYCYDYCYSAFENDWYLIIRGKGE
jgi:hypothetical protein